jgi:hypothetical protein
MQPPDRRQSTMPVRSGTARAALVVLSVAACWMVHAHASAQEAKPAKDAGAKAAPAWTISGYVFGDYYYFAKDHDARFDGQKGFWLRRGYFTYDHDLTERLTTRFRLEVNSNGRMVGGSLTPYVKDAYLRWTFAGEHRVFIGLQPTPTIEAADSVWGLRYVEKVPVDLYRFDSTRDLGIGVAGRVNDSGTIRYAVQLGNDSGTGSETDGGMALRFTARYDANPGVFVEGAYWHSDRPLGADRQGVQGFAAYRHEKGRVGINVAWHERQGVGELAPDTTTGVASAFGVLDLKPGKLSVFARLDRVMDPIPDGNLDYLPISTASPFTFALAGVEYRVLPSVVLSPNVEFLRYGAPEIASAARPADDVVLRATFYWGW